MITPGASVVVKVGGRAQRDPRLGATLAEYWAAWQRASREPGAPRGVCCVVHGGGDEVSALQRAAGIEPTFIGGRRVTRPDDIDRLRMALSGLANKRLVAALNLVGASAVGISGEDGPLLLADVLGDGALGAVGSVHQVDTSLLTTLVSAGYLPVIAPVAAASRQPVARDAEGHGGESPPVAAALNVNGDDAAAAIAVALGATELLLVSDVSGVRVDGQPTPELTSALAERAIADGEIAGGMVAKVRAALRALERGVTCVRIGTLEILDGTEAGTVLTRLGRARAAYASTSHGAAA
jgi:acetylglutamate kinase